MMTFLKNLFLSPEPKKEEKNDFSEFFIHAKSGDKAKVIKQVLREATEEQREIVRKYKEKVAA